MIALRTLFLASTLMIGVSSPLLAEESPDLHPSLTQSFALDAGMFFPNRRVKLGVDGSVGDNNRILDFQEELRLKGSDETFAVDFGWRFSENWFLFGQHFRSSNHSSTTLRNDIPWKDIIFPQGSDVVVGSGFEVLGLTAGRKLNSSEHHEFGLAGGFHLFDVAAYIEGTAVDGGGISEVRRELVTTSGPLPTVGAWYKYSISSKWAFETKLDWIEASVGKYDGHLIDITVGVNYLLGKHVGVGLDYHKLELNVNVNEDNWRGQVFTSYEGMYIYLSAYW